MDLKKQSSSLDLDGKQFQDQSLNQLATLPNINSITSINLSNNHITDLSVLSKFECLTTLKLQQNNIKDLSPLSNLKQLKILLLDYNPIIDVSPLAQLYNLEELSLCLNNFLDISLLRHLKKLKKVNIDLMKLKYPPYWYAYFCKYNKMADPIPEHELPAIEKIWRIMVSGNPKNIALAKQLATSQGWGKQDFKLYDDLIQLYYLYLYK